jgi:hypothetical protein
MLFLRKLSEIRPTEDNDTKNKITMWHHDMNANIKPVPSSLTTILSCLLALAAIPAVSGDVSGSLRAINEIIGGRVLSILDYGGKFDRRSFGSSFLGSVPPPPIGRVECTSLID